MGLRTTRAHDHDTALAESLLARLRERLAIPTTYSIQVELVCPDKMPQAYGETSWSYLPGRSYTIRLRCNFSPEEIEWVLTHELLEIHLSDLYQFTHEEIETHRSRALQHYLVNRHRELRDSVIEVLSHVILQKARPLSALG